MGKIYDLTDNGGSTTPTGIRVAIVNENSTFPTERPNGGGALQNEDYVTVNPQANVPFTIGDVTFENKKTKAVYFDGKWIPEPGILQDTSETPVKNSVKESISGKASFQSKINEEIVKLLKGYTHIQETPSSIWYIAHMLDCKPSVICVDNEDQVIYGGIKYITANNLEVQFARPVVGKAYINK